MIEIRLKEKKKEISLLSRRKKYSQKNLVVALYNQNVLCVATIRHIKRAIVNKLTHCCPTLQSSDTYYASNNFLHINFCVVHFSYAWKLWFGILLFKMQYSLGCYKNVWSIEQVRSCSKQVIAVKKTPGVDFTKQKDAG